MRQTQIQRKRHKPAGDNEPEDIPTEVTEQSARASRNAEELLAKIDQETS